MTEPEFLTTRQLAERWGYQQTTLRSWRKRGIGPPYIEASNRRVIYRLSEVKRWEEENTKEPTNA